METEEPKVAMEQGLIDRIMSEVDLAIEMGEVDVNLPGGDVAAKCIEILSTPGYPPPWPLDQPWPERPGLVLGQYVAKVLLEAINACGGKVVAAQKDAIPDGNDDKWAGEGPPPGKIPGVNWP